MEMRALHADGPQFSRIIAGAWRWHTISAFEVEKLIHAALDCGVTSFDHADIYGDHANEEIFGNVIRRNPALRHGMQLITKCGIKLLSPKRPATRIKHYDTSKHHIMWSAENSLRMLGTDHLDLLLLHRPDPLMEPEEVAEAFSTLKHEGKIRHAGVSNFTVSQFEMLQAYLPFPLVTNQIELSLLKHTPFFDGTVDTLMKHRVSPMAWSPLGGGSLLQAGHVAEYFRKGNRWNATATQLSLAWLLHHPSTVFPVIGTTKTDRLYESAQSVHIQLDKQDWFGMLKIATGTDVP